MSMLRLQIPEYGGETEYILKSRAVFHDPTGRGKYKSFLTNGHGIQWSSLKHPVAAAIWEVKDHCPIFQMEYHQSDIYVNHRSTSKSTDQIRSYKSRIGYEA